MPCHYNNPGSTFTSNKQLQTPQPSIPGPAYNSVGPTSPLAVKGSQCISQSPASIIIIIYQYIIMDRHQREPYQVNCWCICCLWWQQTSGTSVDQQNTPLPPCIVWSSNLLLYLVTRPSPNNHCMCLTNKDNRNLALLYLHSLHS